MYRASVRTSARNCADTAVPQHVRTFAQLRRQRRMQGHGAPPDPPHCEGMRSRRYSSTAGVPLSRIARRMVRSGLPSSMSERSVPLSCPKNGDTELSSLLLRSSSSSLQGRGFVQVIQSFSYLNVLPSYCSAAPGRATRG